MTNYLKYRFADSPEFVDTFDELPLWSASFGLLLLKNLHIQPNSSVLDIGCGTGFPLLEIASRMGETCACFGLDPWQNAVDRLNKKIANYGISNTTVVAGSAESMPYDANSMDYIVSNLGINNFGNRDAALAECLRVLKPNGKLALTTNLYGHWKEFYTVFAEVMASYPVDNGLEKLKEHEEHRGTVTSLSNWIEQHGFTVSKCVEDSFTMTFANGTAFFNHYFVKLGWLESWMGLVPEPMREAFFTDFENRLNTIAQKNGALILTVPMLYLEGTKN